MSPEEWDTLEWWKQRLYLEGFEDEGLVSREGASTTRTHQTASGATVTEADEHATFSGQEGEFAAFGFNETTL